MEAIHWSILESIYWMTSVLVCSSVLSQLAAERKTLEAMRPNDTITLKYGALTSCKV